ncbi:MCE family protein [Intrasporangium sp.]|uniref:MCE family protein n=1 Tax=Intrasporangium sp. TaxID=1925024 RepID=UPI00293A3703|nr:MCE family protein [Intrasporangium sp.]MDV3220560.1 MCE family protein [Intrasporangium sp.]
MRTTGSLVKLLLFAVVTLVATSILALTIANVQVGAKAVYQAVFSDATGVAPGQDVRIAGVRVGEITGVRVGQDRASAVVEFQVLKTSVLTEGTEATLKYRNLVGQRYLALTQGPGGARPLPDGGTIPLSRTHPALDLTVLFNGFKPLFAALSPQDVNELSGLIVQTLQGQGSDINALLSRTASLTTAIADRDAVIGRTIDNLTAVLGTVEDHDDQLLSLIDQLQRFTSGLAEDRETIGRSLSGINALSAETADLLMTTRPLIKEDVGQLRTLAATLNKPANVREFASFIESAPQRLEQLTRTATYGSWFNFYLCQFDMTNPILPGVSPTYQVSSARCS